MSSLWRKFWRWLTVSEIRSDDLSLNPLRLRESVRWLKAELDDVRRYHELDMRKAADKIAQRNAIIAMFLEARRATEADDGDSVRDWDSDDLLKAEYAAMRMAAREVTERSPILERSAHD